MSTKAFISTSETTRFRIEARSPSHGAPFWVRYTSSNHRKWYDLSYMNTLPPYAHACLIPRTELFSVGASDRSESFKISQMNSTIYLYQSVRNLFHAEVRRTDTVGADSEGYEQSRNLRRPCLRMSVHPQNWLKLVAIVKVPRTLCTVQS